MERGNIAVAILCLILFFNFTIVSATINNQTQTNHQGSNHFVLVHGACLGAWTWHKLVPLLESSGHQVTSLDLSASGINLSRANDIKSYSDYSKPLIDFMSSLSLNEKVILVGHSLGGISISQVMELFPNKVAAAVFLTAFMPGPSFPLSSDVFKEVQNRVLVFDNKLTYDNGPNNPPTTFIFGPKYTSQVLYQFSSSEDAALANLLLRQRPLLTGEELVFTKAKYGSVKKVYIKAEQDQVLKVDLQNAMIMRNHPTKVLTIRGSDHMVMFSQTKTLYAYLLRISRDFA